MTTNLIPPCTRLNQTQFDGFSPLSSIFTFHFNYFIFLCYYLFYQLKNYLNFFDKARVQT